MRTLILISAVVLLGGVAISQSRPDPAVRDRAEDKLRPGDFAPDFELKRLGSDSRVRLSESHGKKLVALVFGSYT